MPASTSDEPTNVRNPPQLRPVQDDNGNTIIQSTTSSNLQSESGVQLAFQSTAAIHRLLDDSINAFSKPWQGEILFNVCIWKSGMSMDSIRHLPLQQANICTYLNGKEPSCYRLYFSKEDYPPPTSDDEMVCTRRGGSCRCKGWMDLRRDLSLAALDGGNPIVCNGSNGRLNHRTLKCGHCYRKKRRSKAMTVNDKNPYRSTSLVHNRKNNRSNGMCKAKRVKTTDQKTPCKMGFTIKWDSHGFYVELQRASGNGMHNDHPRLTDPSVIPFPTRLLTQEQIEQTCNVVTAASNKGAGRNYHLNTTGRFMSSVKIAYLQDRSNGDPTTKTKDDIDAMIDDFTSSDDIKFTTLSDIPLSVLQEDVPNEGDEYAHLMKSSQDTITMSTTKSDDGSIVATPVNTIDELQSLDLDATAKQQRSDRALSKSELMFMSVGWRVNRNFRLFLTCPEVVWCDVTSHSNNKGFHLLTFSCRLSVDKQLVFLWIWIPNQQRSSFRWVFQHAIPILIPKHHRERVRMIMKDGDPQQRNEILLALTNVFTRTRESTCGMHIGQFGFLLHVPGIRTISTINRPRWITVVKQIKKHIYSWMRPGYAEDETEYKISKCILLQYICSATVLSAAEGKVFMIVAILKFLRGHVFVHEQLYLHYRRRDIRCLDVAHASPHEVSLYSVLVLNTCNLSID